MRNLIDELKRRNVIRVVMAYAVAAWVIVQAVDMAADAFDAPVWIMQMTLALAFIGLIPAILFPGFSKSPRKASGASATWLQAKASPATPHAGWTSPSLSCCWWPSGWC